MTQNRSPATTGKKWTVREIYAGVFLELLLIFGLVSCGMFVQFRIDKLLLPKSTESQSTTADAFSVQYPFTEETAETDTESHTGLFRKYLYLARQFTEKTESYLLHHNLFLSLVNTFSVSHSTIVINGANTFITLPDGYLAGCFTYCPSYEAWESIRAFSVWLDGQDTPFLYLITPDKADDSITVFPVTIPHGYTQTLREQKDFMDKYGIDYLEAKQVLLAENDDFYSWFYKSDLHWNVRAAYRMAAETAEILNSTYSVPTDTTALADGDFTSTIYSDSFLGGYGQKLGDKWKEDMEILYPVAETSFRIQIPKSGIDRTGSFAETLIDSNRIEEGNVQYSCFLYGDNALTSIENYNCQNGTRVLVIKYSFADPYCPYLASTVQYLDIIDPRIFDGSIRSYIEQTNPDAVILCLGAAIEGYESSLQLK